MSTVRATVLASAVTLALLAVGDQADELLSVSTPDSSSAMLTRHSYAAGVGRMTHCAVVGRMSRLGSMFGAAEAPGLARSISRRSWSQDILLR